MSGVAGDGAYTSKAIREKRPGSLKPKRYEQMRVIGASFVRMLPPIFWITGPPASGKSTLCAALLARCPKGVHVPVDDMRTWVVSGLSESVPWTDETERQFQVAEAAACAVARRYHEAGFAVAIDHCRNMSRLEDLIQRELAGLEIVKVCLMPSLEENLRRSHTRTNKSFDPHLLDETIRFTNELYRLDVPLGWRVIDNSNLTLEDTIARLGPPQ